MIRVLGIELRRSVALGTGLALLVVGLALLVGVGPDDGWRRSWMLLVLDQRLYLIVLWPLAVAAGAWQGGREPRTKVGELFDSTPLPRHRRVLPTATALALAAAGAYLAVLAVAVAVTASTTNYRPVAAVAVAGVGALSLVVAVWVGMGIGQFLPYVVTAPALAVVAFGLLLVGQMIEGPRRWLPALASPVLKTVVSAEYFTMSAAAVVAQATWLIALAAAGLVLLAAGRRRAALAALLPLVLGAGLAATVMPRSGDSPGMEFDREATELVCAQGTPRVCVTRVHSDALPAVTPLARQGLAMLAKLPGAPTSAEEDYGWFYSELQPQRPDVVPIWVDAFARDYDGPAFAPDRYLVHMLDGAGTRSLPCEAEQDADRAARRAVAYWLMGSRPAPDPEGDDPGITGLAEQLWQGLRALPEPEAARRVAALRVAAMACTGDLDALLAGKTS